jgi:very-short-patch-repair endonuclease
MGSEDIVVSSDTRRGVRALKDFLTFAETGYLVAGSSETSRPPDSDFEVAVADALGRVGYECTAQLGVAGFFIDIAVRDPGNPSRYLMGIECDGASYHSAKSVRDRDRLRQDVLQRLGWRIRRIWSTDWYRNPEAELGPLLEELGRLRTETQPAVEEAPEAAVVEGMEAVRETEEADVAELLAGAGDLGQKLELFDREVIRPAIPKTPEGQRLLRPAMVEALLEYRPATKWEFVEVIPSYLRQGTLGAEGVYLEQVLGIIAEGAGEMA